MKAKIGGKNTAWILVILILIVNYGCKKKTEQVDISDVEIQSELHRFDQALFSPVDFTETELTRVKAEYPEFYPTFNQFILRSPKSEEVQSINAFRHYFDSLEVSKMIQKEYGDFDKEFTSISAMQKRLKALFPDYQAIDVTTMNSGFQFKNMLLENTIGVGLELYLDGVDYTQMGDYVQNYDLHTYDKSYVIRDVGYNIVQDIFPDSDSYSTLLDRMVYGGKHLFLLEKILPQTADSLLIGMTEEDFDWCEENEQDIWRYFVSEELLYSNNYDRIKTYVTVGPFSTGMPPEAPALTGYYIGWKLMQNYARNHPEKGIRALIFETNPQEILQGAKYNP